MRIVRYATSIISSVDLDGMADALVLDADGNTSISAPTDNQIDFEINGADDFTMAANVFNVLSGSNQVLADSSQLRFGDGAGGDITMAWDGTDFDVLQLTANSSIKWGVSGAGIDHVFYGDTIARDLTWDQSADSLIFNDSTVLQFGTSSIATFSATGTTLSILAGTDNNTIIFGATGNSFDIVINGSTSSFLITFDASANDLKFEDSVSIMLGTGAGAGVGNAGDVELRWDATDLDMLAAADDTVFKIGNGTNSFDVWVYGNTASEYILWDASADKLSFEGGAYVELSGGSRHAMTGVTGNTSPAATDSGATYVVTGGTGVTFTLPAVATSAGLYYHFINGVDQNMTVDGPAGTLVVFNNTGATSIAYSTASEKIGASVSAFCNGTKWYIQNHLGAEAQTITVT